MLRQLRATPPGRAASEPRSATFRSSLQQSEELFGAAAEVGPASRPILLFYGLSQAGRAVAAASATSDWELRGHGLKVVKSTDEGEGLASVCVRANGKGGAFQVLAEILRSGPLPNNTRLAELWPLLQETRRFPLPNSADTRWLTLTAEQGPRPASDSWVFMRVGNLPVRLVAPPTSSAEEGAEGCEWSFEREQVRRFLSQYPTLAGWRFSTPEGQPAGLERTGGSTVELTLLWNRLEGESDKDAVLRRCVEHRGESLVFPAVGGSDMAAHPLMIWWAILLFLSSLARYEPHRWAKITSVDNSEDATAVEHLLGEALVSLPELIHRTIRQVVSSGRLTEE